MDTEYILGYISGYEDGTKGERAQDYPQRRDYNTGYDCGYEDGLFDETPEYNTRDDLDE